MVKLSEKTISSFTKKLETLTGNLKLWLVNLYFAMNEVMQMS